MPAGPTLLGLGYFAAIKLAGYSLAAKYLRAKSATPPKQNAFIIGATRTAIGMVFGTLVIAALASLTFDRHSWLFFVLLVPVRMVEWWLLFALFFGEVGWTGKQKLTNAALGVLWSFTLDLPAIFAAFALPGGFWIC